MSEDHRFLFAVDTSGNEVFVLAVHGEELTPVDRVASAGTGPVTVTVRHNLVGGRCGDQIGAYITPAAR